MPERDGGRRDLAADADRRPMHEDPGKKRQPRNYFVNKQLKTGEREIGAPCHGWTGQLPRASGTIAASLPGRSRLTAFRDLPVFREAARKKAGSPGAGSHCSGEGGGCASGRLRTPIDDVLDDHAIGLIYGLHWNLGHGAAALPVRRASTAPLTDAY